MSPEEINKKISELLHTRLNLINGESLSSEELQKEVEGATKEITDKVFEEISALPTIKGWVARDKNDNVFFYFHRSKPTREESGWNGFGMLLKGNYFPNLRWGDEPIEVELPIIIIK